MDEDAIQTNGFNVNYGGNQRKIPLSESQILSEACLGNGPRILNAGDSQYFQFEDESGGPFDLNDTHLHKETRDEEVMVNGTVIKQTREGWLGKPKGMKQILWEMGLWNPEMKKISNQIPPPSLIHK
jgi:hypothetical protein